MRRRASSGKASSKLVSPPLLISRVAPDDSTVEVPKPVHQNDAERILFALESMRNTPLANARNPTAFSDGSLPSDLIGSSSRQLRKAISVPLATAQTGENFRHRRDRERQADKGVSVTISPYGRRREVDLATRDARRTQHPPDGESG